MLLVRHASIKSSDTRLSHSENCLQARWLHLKYQVSGCPSNEAQVCVQHYRLQQIFSFSVRKCLVLLWYLCRVGVQDRADKFLS